MIQTNNQAGTMSKKRSLKSVAPAVRVDGWEVPMTSGVAWHPVSNIGAAQ